MNQSYRPLYDFARTIKSLEFLHEISIKRIFWMLVFNTPSTDSQSLLKLSLWQKKKGDLFELIKPLFCDLLLRKSLCQRFRCVCKQGRIAIESTLELMNETTEQLSPKFIYLEPTSYIDDSNNYRKERGSKMAQEDPKLTSFHGHTWTNLQLHINHFPLKRDVKTI